MAKFKEAAEVYRQKLHAEGRLTIDTDRRIARLNKYWGNVNMSDISAIRIQRFTYEKFGRASPSTVNRNLAVLSAILSTAQEAGILKGDKPRIRRRRFNDIREVHLELRDIMPIVQWIAENKGPLIGFCILLLIDTGMRFGEMMRFRWGDLQEDWITVRGNGNGKSRAHMVPTSPRLLEYMVTYNILPTTDDQHVTPIVYSRWTGANTQIGKELNRALREACHAVGAACAGNIRVHDLRHTFAFLCASAGADLGDIKELMGHANISMTMRYRGFVKTRAADVIRKGMAAGVKTAEELNRGRLLLCRK